MHTYNIDTYVDYIAYVITYVRTHIHTCVHIVMYVDTLFQNCLCGYLNEHTPMYSSTLYHVLLKRTVVMHQYT